MNKNYNNHNNSLLRLILLRTIIVLIIVSLLALFLYSSKIFEGLGSDKFLNVYSFTAIVPKEVINKFEQETGINVRITYFQSNEELLAKFNISGGYGYDVIIVSDYMIETLKNNKLLKKIDKSHIPNFELVDPRLKNKYYDPSNDFSIPLVWTPYGFGVDKEFFKVGLLENPSWKLIFQDPKVLSSDYKNKGINIPPFKVILPDDPREAINYASFYLYGKALPLSKRMLEDVRRLLIKQKEWVESYTNEKMEHMLSLGVVPIVIAPAAYMLRAVSIGEKFDFVLPHEGSLMVIENIALPEKSKNTLHAYKFINFLLSNDSMLKICEKYFYNPANLGVIPYLPEYILSFIGKFSKDEVFSKLSIIKNNLVPLEEIDELWLALKAA